MLNEQLIAELPQLLDLRVPFFDPSFEAMIRMQCKFAEEGYEKLSGVQRFVLHILHIMTSLTVCPGQILRRQRPRRLCSWTARCSGGRCASRNARIVYLWGKLNKELGTLE